MNSTQKREYNWFKSKLFTMDSLKSNLIAPNGKDKLNSEKLARSGKQSKKVH